MKLFRCLLVVCVFFRVSAAILWATIISTNYGISYQVNVDAAGQNIPGDAANEPTLCIDPTNPNRIAVGWRQFDTTNSDFRQAGVAYSTNGGLNWTFPGSVDAGTFRSDPVLASDANGVFYYLGITNDSTFACDLVRSTNGGATWQPVGPALGGDKEWMTIDTTGSPGRGNIYEVWSPFYNVYNNQNQIFTRSTDGGNSWMTAIGLPHLPYFGTIAVGPNGEVYAFGTAIDVEPFWINRSSDATNPFATPTVDVSTVVDLGGPPAFGVPIINPGGLLGQAWVAVDRSTNSTRGYVYVLCSVTNDPGNLANVMFARSTDGGQTWSAPLRINDDSPNQNACHWFGTLSVAPNGRIDACWNDTRHSADNSTSELYYSWSEDGGLAWAPNRPLSPPFNQSLGYPQQEKIGDYMGMISLDEGACIAYAATFNGEEDVYFVRAELPIVAQVTLSGGAVVISWNGVPGVSYCVQALADLSLPWSSATDVGCLVATNITPMLDDPRSGNTEQRFYRVVRDEP
jgi:BNR/Asp-box repeat